MSPNDGETPFAWATNCVDEVDDLAAALSFGSVAGS